MQGEICQRIEEAAKQYRLLQNDMRNQYEHFQMVLNDESAISAYDNEQILHMEKYTEEFMEKKQKEILNSVKQGRAKGVYEAFLEDRSRVGR